MDDKRRLILDQALALVDEHGLAAMSMRAVAERVGLTSMALYPYVGGKDALLDGLVDLLTIELGTSYGEDPADIDWRQRLRALGRAVRKLAHEHPGAFPLLLNRPAAAASASWLTAALRGVLHDAGAAPEQVARLARMICAFLLGYTTGEVTGGLPAGATTAGATTAGAATGGPSAPPAAANVPSPAAPPHPGENAEAVKERDRGTEAVEEHDGGAQVVEGRDAEAGGPDVEARQRAGAAEFDADLEDLVRLVEVAVRVG